MPDACKDVEAYKDKATEDDSGYLQISWNTWVCETWADENGNQKLAHNSFNTLDNLYSHESSALQTELWPNKNAPVVCKVFQDYQKANHDAIMADVAGRPYDCPPCSAASWVISGAISDWLAISGPTP